MKKVAFLCCLFCGLITQAIGATYNCRPQSLGSLAFKRSNEYLFPDDSRYDDKIALVCGHKGTDGCEHGDMVWVRGKHVHKNGEIAEPGLYRCDTKGGSSWEPINLEDLEDCPNPDELGIPWDEWDGYGLYVGRGYRHTESTNDGTGYFTVTKAACVVETSRGYSKRATSEEKKTDTEKTEQGAKQNQSGDAGENEEDKWLEPCSQEDLLKVPHATAGRYIYKTKDEIVCAATKCDEGYYLVRNENRESQGWCKYGKDPYATTNASETTSGQGASSSDASGTGATGADATGADATGAGTYGTGTFTQNQPGGGTSGQAQPTAPVEEKSPCELKQSGWRWFEGRCITDKQHQNILAERQAAKVRALTQKIESTASQLDSMSSRFKVSVWKDAEGKFNTARLASDSIAGVVLGTAGGLITSHVVKKNQVENGFQDIKCTIGGQSVANWGDEFSVGIQ